MREYGIEMISPNRSNRKQKTQDGRPLRRYRRRWKVGSISALAEFEKVTPRKLLSFNPTESGSPERHYPIGFPVAPRFGSKINPRSCFRLQKQTPLSC
jgi:hypothetical protein